MQLVKLLLHPHLPLQGRLSEFQEPLLDFDVDRFGIRLGGSIGVTWIFDVIVDLQP